MKEGAKTLIFVVVTIVLLGAAWGLKPRPIVELTDNEVGELYPNFKDPLKAKSLEIISYDEDTAALEPFKVAQVNGRWSIPSHSNYPADAANQLAAAATSMMDLEKLDIASSNPAEHELYGVVDPKSPNLAAGTTGVGKRVTFQDAANNTLADYIIGKADEKQPGVRFVRIPGQDPVYRVLVSTDKLSTNFGDWIEKDLLKMNAFDVKQVVLNNHSVDEANLALRYDSIISVDFDSKESKWELNDLRVGPKQTEATLKPDEELNTEKLNELKTALDDLKIVDVSRKPPGLSADLRVDEKAVKNTSMESLMEHGFFPAKINGKLELVSNEGEVHCGMSDGVDYVLRFGEIAGAGKKKEEKKTDKKDEKPEAAAGVNRYIMVTTHFQKDLIPEPELEDVPALPVKAGPAAPAKADAKAESTKADAPKAETPKADASKPAAAKTDKKPDASGKPAARKGASKAKKPAADEPATGGGCGADPAADDDADEKPADEKAVDKKPADAKAADVKKPEAPKSPEELERDRVVQENKRKQDEYDAKIKDGEKRVKELNDRFADWYYIISNETYQKIHLSRDQVIKKKEKPKDEAGAKATEEPPKQDPFQKFNELQNQGLPK